MEKHLANYKCRSAHAACAFFARFALLASLFVFVGCSQVPDAANPVEWYKGVEGWFGDDDPAHAEQVSGVLDPALEREPRLAGDEAFPNLSEVPERPPAYDPEDAAEITEGLVADRTHAKYSDETIRFQSESGRTFSMQAPAPRRVVSKDAPPPLAAPRSPVDLAGELSEPRAIPGATPEMLDSQAPEMRVITPPPPPVLSQVSKLAAPPPVAPPLVARNTAPPAVFSRLPIASPPPVAAALRIPASDIVPSLPYFPSGAPQLNQAMHQNFAQSGASALPANFQQPMAPPANFQQPITPPALALNSGVTSPATDRKLPVQKRLVTESMANGDAPRALAEFDPNALGMSIRVATVYFSVGATSLDKKSRQILRDVVGMFRQKGTSIRVIGHASSRTRDLDPMVHKLANFNISVDRANAVAKGLMQLGIVPQQLFVGAQSDSEPIYFEVMPSGEAGNRRAEIYIDY